MKNITISLLMLLLVVINSSCKKETAAETRPMRKDIKEWVFAPGQIEWDDMYNVTAQTEGILLDADYEIGDAVSEGDVLGIIDNKSSVINTGTSRDQLIIADENLTSTSPSLLQLKKNIEFAEDKYKQDKLLVERYERLYNKQSIAKIEYENVVLSAKNSLSNLEALKKQYDVILQQARQQKIITKGQLKNNEVVQGYNKVIIVRKGNVIKKLKNTGDFVRKGDVIAVVANPEKIEVTLNVDENSINKVKKGQKATIRLNTEKDMILKGKVTDILSAFDQSSQSFICKIVLDEKLEENYNIYGTPLEGNILTGEKKNVLLIPRTFLGNRNTVLVKGQKVKKTIKTGIVSTDYAEVLEGLTENDILLPLQP